MAHKPPPDHVLWEGQMTVLTKVSWYSLSRSATVQLSIGETYTNIFDILVVAV